MVVIAAAAAFGAALGLFVRPGLKAVVLAALWVGAVQYGAPRVAEFLESNAGLSALAGLARAIVVVPRSVWTSPLAAAVFAACATALWSALNRTGEARRRRRRLSAATD
jgi:hypothetical protein